MRTFTQKNAEEMEKLEQLKADTEAKLKVDRERLEKEAEESRKNKQDTQKLKMEMEAAKQAMEEAANSNSNKPRRRCGKKSNWKPEKCSR